jgi:ATP-dependent Clp protease ATP-binding subunit ClpA
MLSKELEFSLNLAFKEAREKHHEFMTVEHLLFALLGNPSAVEVLRACGADLEQLKQELARFLDETTPRLAAEDTRETQPTLGFQRVLQRAVFHVQTSDKNEVTGANVLVAMFSEQESQAVYLLNRMNITRLDVVTESPRCMNRAMKTSKARGRDPLPRAGRNSHWRISPPISTNLPPRER